MKKTALILGVISILATLILSFALSSAAELPLRVVVNGNKVTFPDAQPFVDSNYRTQVPVRFVSQALGATVGWEESTNTVTVSKGDKEITLVIGKKEFDVSGQKKQMDTAALLKNDRTFVPARYIAEALGGTVKWDSAVNTVYIEMKSVTVDTGSTRDVSGFIVPKNIDLMVSAPKNDINYETTFSIDFLRRDVEKQKDDLEKILLQKFSEETVKQIMDHVRTKTKATDVLERKRVYDSKTSQYISITKSVSDTIDIWVFKKGIAPGGN